MLRLSQQEQQAPLFHTESSWLRIQQSLSQAKQYKLTLVCLVLAKAALYVADVALLLVAV